MPVPERIACFDNDGTLWTEQPIYFQIAFAFDRVKAMVSRHPEWRTREPFKSVLADDRAALAALGEKGFIDIVAATHAGMTTEEFTKAVLDWLATARHPRFDRPYTDLVYQPMIELLALLRASSHVLCDRPSLPLVEQSLRQNRAQLIRMPIVHCAQSYLGSATIDALRKEIGLLAG